MEHTPAPPARRQPPPSCPAAATQQPGPVPPSFEAMPFAGTTRAVAAAATAALALLAAAGPRASAFAPPAASSFRAPGRRARVASIPGAASSSSASFGALSASESDEEAPSVPVPAAEKTRRAFLRSAAFAALVGVGGTADPAFALVKGNAPPPKKEKAEKKCTNVEECQEMAERLAAQQEEENRAASSANPPQIAPKGSRYRVVEESPDGDSAPIARVGDALSVRYKVLKLGKRSYDGLSGEGTVVFSRGYGLEDDEYKPGEKTFDFTLGSPLVIDALNDALHGMPLGSTRRISVLPQMGWRKPGRECDGGPGGSGAGGDLKTDYVVVPTATMVAEEACFARDKLPFPTAYAQQRRMAQRFDQSLIVEVQLVGINQGK